MALRQETAPALADSGPDDSCAVSSNLKNSGDSPDEGTEVFQDATEYHPPYDMDLHISFEDCEVAIRKFFNNDLAGAMNIMKPWCRTSLYHSLGASIFEFIPAMLTFEHEQICRAVIALKQCVHICIKNRKSFTLVESLGTIIKKPNYASYTDLEAHAELCYAEALLLQAAITIMEGEDLTGLIKGTIKVKSCYTTYKECAKILEKKQFDTDESKKHFQSGVRLGLATFNVMISLLPPRVISLLEFVGFSGNKATGLAELQAASRAPGMRSILCDLTLLGFHLVICQFIGASGDLKVCDEILEKVLKIYPESVWFLVFKGRLQLLRGMFEPAITTYNTTLNSQHNFKQFRHLCFWELMWVNSLKMEWRESAQFATKLLDESTWSRTIYSYCKAAMFLQLGSDMTANEKHQCNELLRNCSFYKQRIAGKSLPMEKFMIKRAARYYTQGGRLVLPAIELLCLWNMFGILTFSPKRAQYVLKLIEATRDRVEDHRFDWMGVYVGDNRALLRYMHGCCLSAMGVPRMALTVLNEVFQLKGDIKEDTFIIPYTAVEIAMCHYQLGDTDKAIQLLNEARKKYSGYALESRLHFRIHSKLDMIKSEIAEKEGAAAETFEDAASEAAGSEAAGSEAAGSETVGTKATETGGTKSAVPKPAGPKTGGTAVSEAAASESKVVVTTKAVRRVITHVQHTTAV